MRALARRIGLGLAGRGDIEDVIRWTRLARDGGLDFDLDPRLAVRARRDHLRHLDRPDAGQRRDRIDGRGHRGREPLHPAPSGPGHDRLRARRGPARADRHGHRNGNAPASGPDGHPLLPRRRGHQGRRNDRPAADLVGRAAASLRPRRACHPSSRCSRRSTASRSTSPATGKSWWNWPAGRPTATSPGRASRSLRCGASWTACAPQPRRRAAIPVDRVGRLPPDASWTRRAARP